MKKKQIGAIAFAASATLFIAGCSTSSTPAESPAETAVSSPAASAMADGTVVEVAAGNPDFSTLVAAVQAADLTETLNAEGPYTVFAPTNEAFEALPAGTVEKLLKPANKDALTKILTYHVVAGEEIMAADITAGKVATVEGQKLDITTDDGVQVNGVTVVTADVDASNGVIHAIDGVLIPPDVDPAAFKGAGQ